MFVTLDQRTPNLGLKYESDDTRNYNWAKLDDQFGRILEMMAGGGAETPRARVRSFAGQSIPHNVETKVTFDSVQASVGNLFDPVVPDRFTIQEAGFYLLGGFLEFESGISTAGTHRTLLLSVNDPLAYNAGYLAVENPAPARTLPVGIMTSSCLSVVVGDVVYMLAKQDSGVVLQVKPGAFFWIVRVA